MACQAWSKTATFRRTALPDGRGAFSALLVALFHQYVAYRNYKVLDWIFLAVTGFVAYHALTHRNEDGENDIGHMLFGSIALLFFARVLLVDILKIW